MQICLRSSKYICRAYALITFLTTVHIASKCDGYDEVDDMWPSNDYFKMTIFPTNQTLNRVSIFPCRLSFTVIDAYAHEWQQKYEDMRKGMNYEIGNNIGNKNILNH